MSQEVVQSAGTTLNEVEVTSLDPFRPSCADMSKNIPFLMQMGFGLLDWKTLKKTKIHETLKIPMENSPKQV